MDIALEVFMTGLALGVSRCLIACAPMVVIFIAGTTKNWRQGLKAAAVFSLSRLSAYVLLGLLAGLGGLSFSQRIQGAMAEWIWIGTGIFIVLVGVLMVLGKEPRIHLCKVLFKNTVSNSFLTMALLGLLTAFVSFCPAMIGILAYIAFMVQEPLKGAFLGLCFGLGSAVITPLVAIGVLASVIPSAILKNQKILAVFQRCCGLLFLFLGGRLIFDAWGGS
jgi:hypothetical protein